MNRSRVDPRLRCDRTRKTFEWRSPTTDENAEGLLQGSGARTPGFRQRWAFDGTMTIASFCIPSALASMHFGTPQRKQDDGSPGVFILPPIGCCALTRGLFSRAVFGASQECFVPGAKAEGKIKGRPLL